MSTRSRIRKQLRMKRRVFSRDELHQVLEHLARNPAMQDLHDVATVIADTGIRPRELALLRWTDIDFDGRRILVTNKALTQRSLPFGPKTMNVLIQRRERQPQSEGVLGPSPARILSRVTRQLRATCEQIGIYGVNLHLIRRTCVSHWYKPNRRLRGLARILGLLNRFLPVLGRLEHRSQLSK
ncbi:tyrosine-type recombinase/integrase [Alloacidobacterium dinghuense]|uniref:Tyrosine-type recombinase/integrase n=1 Tax=Alloacidobacterium dinghuense TaxID=2763107 RepID=A0A7G8BHR8_9BACT|nr:tyrosine-type recombinase/integrase [Alloacidobacterium dinghuense]QNI32088.1 tyrosine-type recombinase/integrase [Alloacidobacterium dinghuense]